MEGLKTERFQTNENMAFLKANGETIGSITLSKEYGGLFLCVDGHNLHITMKSISIDGDSYYFK